MKGFEASNSNSIPLCVGEISKLDESCTSNPKSRNLELDEMGSGTCFISFTCLTPNFVQFEISGFRI